MKPFFNKDKNNEPFFLLNADTICHLSLVDLERVHFKLRHEFGVEMTMVVFSKSPPDGDYREIIFDQKRALIKGLGEKKRECSFYTGISIIHPDIIPDTLPDDEPSDFVKDILQPALLRGKVGVYYYDNSLDHLQRSWFDIGSPKLWQNTHLNFIKLLEEEDLPTLWKNRILARNHKVKPLIWSNSKENSLYEVAKNWRGPSYWGTLPNGIEPPQKLFENQILYGSNHQSQIISGNDLPGIGYSGVWEKL